jgi:mannose-1-phosphate guanylyltransferase
MTISDHTWALVLAAGDGRRLSDLTANEAGRAVPKQFCSLRGGPSLLQETLQRAASVARREHTSVIVSASHQRWWQDAVSDLAPENVVVQPANRGTANGILLQLLRVLACDAEAEVVVLPSDHYVADERILEMALRSALEQLRRTPQLIVLLGMVPESPDPQFGYIVPGAADEFGVLGVREFIEKPQARAARLLIERGALWSPFILAAKGSTLLARIEEHLPDIVQAMRAALDSEHTEDRALEALYERLPNLDFSHHILTVGPTIALRVLPVPACGWRVRGGRRRSPVAPRSDQPRGALLRAAEARTGQRLGARVAIRAWQSRPRRR